VPSEKEMVLVTSGSHGAIFSPLTLRSYRGGRMIFSLLTLRSYREGRNETSSIVSLRHC